MFTEKFLKGRLRDDLSPEEKSVLEGSVSRTVRIDARTTVVERGVELDCSFFLVEGTMLRYIDDRKGERQLVQVNIAGEFVDLHGYAMKRLDHSIGALTPCLIAEVPHAAISQLVEKYPHLARALWFSTLLDAAMHREWIFMLGRLSAEGRIAHVIAELLERLRLINAFDGRHFPIPLLQRDFASICGISVVHANRCFRTLKERGLLVLRGEGRIEILNEQGLRTLAEFSGEHLYGAGPLAVRTLRDA